MTELVAFGKAELRIRDLLRTIAPKYPRELVAVQLRDIERIAFHIALVLDRRGTSATVCDIGGGVGMFSVGCAALGMRSILIDDFRDEVNVQFGESALEVHRCYGVRVFSKDAVKDDVELPPGSVDVITCFESMEHWHHSPKRLFEKLRFALKPGGVFVLSAPNCVDLKRRLTVPWGYGKWSSMESWYNSTVFRGHVREPDVDDLRHIATDMGLSDVEIRGRNWWPYSRFSGTLRVIAVAADTILRVRPSLCSTIYVTGHV